MNWAVQSGLAAAFGAVCGKVSGLGFRLKVRKTMCVDGFGFFFLVLGKVAFGDAPSGLAQVLPSSGLIFFQEDATVWAIRGVFATAMMTLNAHMIHFYVKALERGGTLTGTVVNTGTNVLASSLLGYFIFEEVLNAQWLIGAGATVAGIFLIQKSQSKSNDG